MLEELTLDTTTFTVLAERARSRIPAASRGAWTDHNAHDPGITLIELYAYLIEQRVFWLDQVTPALDRALLALLGATPLRARPAQVVVSAQPMSAAHGVLTAGTTLELDATASITFTVDDTIAVVAHRPDALDLRASVTGARQRGVDLRNGRTIVVLPNDGRAAHFDLHLELRTPWVAGDDPVAVLFELVSPVTDAWHPDAQAAPPPAKLEFLVRGPAGLVSSKRVEDGTGGLRRSGVIRLWPGDWRPEADGTYLVRVRTDAATYTTPVRLSQVVVNAALARHRVLDTYVDEQPWPKLPGRAIELRHPNGPPLSGHVRVYLLERALHPWRRWREVQDLTPQGPQARVFVLDGSVVRFGDGRAGRQPVLADGDTRLRVLVWFWAGGGEQGNISAGRMFAHSAFHVTNPVEAVGGRGDESLSEARARAARQLRAVERAVTARDLEELAEATPGVAIGRAIAVVGLDEELPLKVPGLTTVYVVPSAPRGELASERVEAVHVPNPMPDPGALAAVRAHLEQARLLASEIHVRPPRWRDVRLRLRLRSTSADATDLRARLHRALQTYLDPLVGGDEGHGWPLGGAIDPSALLRRAQTELGEASVVDQAAVQAGPGEVESCRPVPIGDCYLPRLIATAVDLHPLADQGGLK
jgi:hypothetical protein